MDLSAEFDELINHDGYESTGLLYHPTDIATAYNIHANGIDVDSPENLCGDFSSVDHAGFYVTGSINDAARFAIKNYYSTAVIIEYHVPRQMLCHCNRKRFNAGEYEDWIEFTEMCRKGKSRHHYDIIEGPCRSRHKGCRLDCKPAGHQVAILSDVVARIFDSNQSKLIKLGNGRSESSDDSDIGSNDEEITE